MQALLTQSIATHCNTLQHTATHCNTLQHTATHCNTLQHTATHYNTLQHTATHCNTLQHHRPGYRRCRRFWCEVFAFFIEQSGWCSHPPGLFFVFNHSFQFNFALFYLVQFLSSMGDLHILQIRLSLSLSLSLIFCVCLQIMFNDEQVPASPILLVVDVHR